MGTPKKSNPGSELRNRDGLWGVRGYETPLLLKLETQTNFDSARAERSGCFAERVILGDAVRP